MNADDSMEDGWGDDPVARAVEFMGATAADWRGRPLLEFEGQHLETAVAKRRAEAREIASTDMVCEAAAYFFPCLFLSQYHSGSLT